MMKDYFGFYMQALLAGLTSGWHFEVAQCEAVKALDHWIDVCPNGDDLDLDMALEFLRRVRKGI